MRKFLVHNKGIWRLPDHCTCRIVLLNLFVLYNYMDCKSTQGFWSVSWTCLSCLIARTLRSAGTKEIKCSKPSKSPIKKSRIMPGMIPWFVRLRTRRSSTSNLRRTTATTARQRSLAQGIHEADQRSLSLVKEHCCYMDEDPSSPSRDLRMNPPKSPTLSASDSAGHNLFL